MPLTPRPTLFWSTCSRHHVGPCAPPCPPPARGSPRLPASAPPLLALPSCPASLLSGCSPSCTRPPKSIIIYLAYLAGRLMAPPVCVSQPEIASSLESSLSICPLDGVTLGVQQATPSRLSEPKPYSDTPAHQDAGPECLTLQVSTPSPAAPACLPSILVHGLFFKLTAAAGARAFGVSSLDGCRN